MPLYLCSTSFKPITLGDKERIAKAITDIHCEVTGAPETFVHVFFFDPEQQHILKAMLGEDVFDGPCQLFGNIRSGRTDDAKARLVDGMRQAVADILALEFIDVSMMTRDVEAKWVMEGGDLLPEPGEEAAWLEKHKQKIELEKC
ncbi:tautomerase family protein [Maricurvus nonylphenolicus]|uniref:tautomerase family protein n=1 Tax=Maricurvus nonylphenolicus TaxID=1008307 RepID=UPI0036F2D667